jgi:flagellin-like hook-associated protein FlgL
MNKAKISIIIVLILAASILIPAMLLTVEAATLNWDISHDSINFGSVQEGYTQPDMIIVTVDAGAQWFYDVKAELTGTDADSFILNTLGLPDFFNPPSLGSAAGSVSVQPKPDLPAKTYMATLIFSGKPNTAGAPVETREITVTFEVRGENNTNPSGTSDPSNPILGDTSTNIPPPLWSKETQPSIKDDDKPEKTVDGYDKSESGNLIFKLSKIDKNGLINVDLSKTDDSGETVIDLKNNNIKGFKLNIDSQVTKNTGGKITAKTDFGGITMPTDLNNKILIGTLTDLKNETEKFADELNEYLESEIEDKELEQDYKELRIDLNKLTPTIEDALEILKFLAGLDSKINDKNFDSAYKASLLNKSDKSNPTISDALEILKSLAKMESKLEDTIKNTDMAKEMVGYSTNDILNNAAQAMLAQSNGGAMSILALSGSIDLSFWFGDEEFVWNDPAKPITVFIPFDAKDNDVGRIAMIDKNTGKPVPGSYYKDGMVYAKVGGTGRYEAAVLPLWVNPFTDVKESDWFYKDVEYVCINDIFKGTGATTFSPNATMTRAMFITTLWRIAGSPAAYGNSFKDVKNGEYYSDAVKWALANKIINIGDGLFMPETEITRQDMAVMIFNYLNYIEAYYEVTADYRDFADEDDIADYAKSAIQNLNKLGIINGKGNNIIDPKGNATRAEVAAMLHRLMVV